LRSRTSPGTWPLPAAPLLREVRDMGSPERVRVKPRTKARSVPKAGGVDQLIFIRDAIVVI
jgi:hypothetical protein